MQNPFFYRQIGAITAANLRNRYRGTWSGFFWVLLNPLLYYLAQGFAFKIVLNLQVDHYWLFLLSGLLPWIFLLQCLEMSTGTFVNSGPLLKSFVIHPLILIWAQIVDNLINFVAAFLIVMLVLSFQISFSWSVLLLPLPLLTLFVFTLSFSSILATLFVFFRDLKFILTFALNVLYFLTPIFYPIDFVPERYRPLINLNPAYKMILPFQNLMTHQDLSEFWKNWFVSVALSLVFAAAAALIWRAKRNQVIFHV